jgi:hypothetical protein
LTKPVSNRFKHWKNLNKRNHGKKNWQSPLPTWGIFLNLGSGKVGGCPRLLEIFKKP